MRTFLFFLLVVLCLSATLPAQNGCSGMALGIGASLNGFLPFPADNLWNQNIAGAPVDPNSDAYINFIGANTPVHPDFGSGLYAGQSIGIPYIVVSGAPLVKVNFTAYGDESDPGPMPIPSNAPIEGYPKPGNGDRHVLVLDRDNCWLYELYDSHALKNGNWDAASAAVWDLLNDEQRPYTWTSADAAGLPIFPGLARYDEVAAGAIKHALRFTLQHSQAAFTPPASHWAANSTNPYAAPMGMRLRLKASYDISGFPPQSQVILAALQQYGMIMADNGSSMYISGDPDDHWNDDDLGALKSVPASAFEVVLMNPIYTQGNVPQGPNPTIASFTANPTTVTKGSAVTLSWNVSNADYNIIGPQVGVMRGGAATVVPEKTTTYTLYSTNQYGRTTSKVKVMVK
jgi:cellobiose-specific phosphotransferase system component IIB